MQRSNLYVQSLTMTDSSICGGSVWSTPAAQRVPCSTCRTYVQRNMESQAHRQGTEVGYPKGAYYTYCSTHWQQPLRMNTHIRRLYDTRIQPFIRMGCTLQKRMRAAAAQRPPKKKTSVPRNLETMTRVYTGYPHKRASVTGKP